MGQTRACSLAVNAVEPYCDKSLPRLACLLHVVQMSRQVIYSLLGN